MQFISFYAVNHQTGATLVSPTVTIFVAGTATLATTYDINGSFLTNPFTGAIDGLVQFRAADGAYDIAIQSGSYVSPGIKALQCVDSTALSQAVAALSQTQGLSVFTTLAAANGSLAFAAGSGALVVADVIGVTVSRARTSSVATITMADSSHVPVIGQKVNISGLADASFNALGILVTGVVGATFTYASIGSNVSTTADTGGVVDRNGLYQKQGASGSGSWSWVSPLGFGAGGLNGAAPVFNTRADLTAALAAGLLVTPKAAIVLGFASPGDGGFAWYSPASAIYTTNGWGVTLDPSTSALALGISITGGSTRQFDAYPTDLGTDTLLQPGRRYYGLTNGQRNVTVGLDATKTFAIMDGMVKDAWQTLSFASAVTQEMDCSALPQNFEYRIANLKNTHGGVVLLDAGPGGTWSAYGTHYLSVPNGNKVRFFKSGLTSLEVASICTDPTCSAPTGTNVHTRSVRVKTVIVGGQSLAELWQEGAVQSSFNARLAQLGLGPVYIIPTAVGGAAICQQDLDNGGSNYWVDTSGYDPGNPSGTLAAGPDLTAALALIASNGGDATQPLPTAIFWAQGEQTSGYIDCPQAPNAALLAQKYIDCTEYVFSRMRAAVVSAGGATNIPVIVQLIGRRTGVLSSNIGRMQAVREAQWTIVSGTTNCFRGPDAWDLPLYDSVHPDLLGMNYLGARWADRYAVDVLSYTHSGSAGDPLLVLPKPTVTSATLNSGENTITVVFSTDANDRLNTPADPFGFTVLDSSLNTVPIARIHWIKTSPYTCKIFLGAIGASGGTLYYPWDNAPGFDFNRALTSVTYVNTLPPNGEQDQLQRVPRSFESAGGNAYNPVEPAKIAL